MKLYRVKPVTGVFKSSEPIYHNSYLRHPLNSISSVAYLLPLFYLETEYSFNQYIGYYILCALAPVSAIWWATTHQNIKYIDNTLVVATKIWLLSNLLENNYLNLISPFYLFIRKDWIFKYTTTGLFPLIVYFNTHELSSLIYLISLLGKVSDSRLGNPYGTCMFHIFSGLAIMSYFRNLNYYLV